VRTPYVQRSTAEYSASAAFLQRFSGVYGSDFSYASVRIAHLIVCRHCTDDIENSRKFGP
jgi:hypothetical protein